MRKFLFLFLFAACAPLMSNAQCVAPTGASVTVAPSAAQVSWQLDTSAYLMYRVQIRRATSTNAAWTTRTVGINVNTTTLAPLLPGQYTWGVRGKCKTTGNWSPVLLGSNFTIPY